MQEFGRTLPTSRALSGKTTKEEVIAAEPFAFQLEKLSIYQTPLPEEVAAFLEELNKLTLSGLKEFPIVLFVKRQDGSQIRTTSTLGEFIKSAKRKDDFLAELKKNFMEQKPKSLSLQLGTIRSRLDAACDRAGLPRRRHGQWTDA